MLVAMGAVAKKGRLANDKYIVKSSHVMSFIFASIQVSVH
jgi:hypothetical protein